MMEYNNVIKIRFTDKAGRQQEDVYGIKHQACAYARLLSELGYHVHDVFDVYRNEPIDWSNDHEQI